jgi:hypothetical protein
MRRRIDLFSFVRANEKKNGTLFPPCRPTLHVHPGMLLNSSFAICGRSAPLVEKMLCLVSIAKDFRVLFVFLDAVKKHMNPMKRGSNFVSFRIGPKPIVLPTTLGYGIF